jgi:hypothetical protein
MIDFVLKSAQRHDVYVIPNLRSARRATKGSCLGSEHCWVDIDNVTERTMRRLKVVLGQGSFMVHSGRGLHVYVFLDDLYGPAIIENLNKQLVSYLGGDSKWAENPLLRLPGSMNHKGRAAGRSSYPVTIEDAADSAIPPWSPSALQELLGPCQPSPSKPRRSEGPRARSAPNEQNGGRCRSCPLTRSRFTTCQRQSASCCPSRPGGEWAGTNHVPANSID